MTLDASAAAMGGASSGGLGGGGGGPGLGDGRSSALQRTTSGRVEHLRQASVESGKESAPRATLLYPAQQPDPRPLPALMHRPS